MAIVLVGHIKKAISAANTNIMAPILIFNFVLIRPSPWVLRMYLQIS
jgi:hypothetical protein